MRFAPLLLLSFLFSWRPAFAGACFTCTTNADCEVIQVDAVCVRWSIDAGCGADRQLCCPGQGCALNNGVPSCLGTNCTLVEGADTDQDGVPDGTDNCPSVSNPEQQD